MEKKIYQISTLTLGALFLLMIYVLYQTYSWLLPFCFTDPDRWLELGNGEWEVSVSGWDRFALFLNWTIYVVIVGFVISRAMKLCLAYRDGKYFSKTTYTLIFQLGGGIMFANVAYYLFVNIQRWILTSTLIGREFSFWTYVDPFIVALFLCGALLCVIGWVMKIATDINDDYRAII